MEFDLNDLKRSETSGIKYVTFYFTFQLLLNKRYNLSNSARPRIRVPGILCQSKSRRIQLCKLLHY